MKEEVLDKGDAAATAADAGWESTTLPPVTIAGIAGGTESDLHSGEAGSSTDSSCRSTAGSEGTASVSGISKSSASRSDSDVSLRVLDSEAVRKDWASCSLA